MKNKTACITILVLSSTVILNLAIAQTYQVGVISSPGTMMKFPGEIVITDSTFTVKMNGKESTKKIVNRPQSNVVYITDGTATDKLTINPIAGRVKGFAYDYSIVLDQDKRFNGAQIIYFCKKKEE